MKQIINIYKPLGLTPLQLIQKLRRDKPEYKDVKIAFAGRLDPLAHGVMLLMIGDETKNRDKYLNLPKEYEFEVLFGVSTDTYDALGLITSSSSEQSESRSNNLTMKQFNNLLSSPQGRTINLEKKINKYIESKLGNQTQPYPPYSSKEVNGKPLFQWARENKLSKVEIPEREIEIYNMELLNISDFPAIEIKKTVIKNIKNVEGDFRQKEILQKWNKFFSLSKQRESRNNNSTMKQFNNFIVAKFRIHCSSGTYVRSLANELGGKIGTGAIAFSILRTKVGEYKLANSINL